MVCCWKNIHHIIVKDHELFHDGGRYHIETSPLICGADQWTGFYMKTAFVNRELNKLRNDKVSQIDIIINKLDHSDNTTILWVFLLIFILNQSYNETHIAD